MVNSLDYTRRLFMGKNTSRNKKVSLLIFRDSIYFFPQITMEHNHF